MNAQPRRSGLVVALLLTAAVVLSVVGLWQGRARNVERAALPTYEGRLQVSGLDAPVEILRDAAGVAHVRARSEVDAWFGLGFVHAQDRLGQMLWRLRLARGRSAEILGESGLAADRLARVLDLGGVADREWEEAPAESRVWLEAYARGVNARIERVRSGEVGAPVAAIRAGLPIEPWQPADSLALLKLHAWALGGSLEASLVLHDLLGALGGVDARPFFPGPGDDALPEPDRFPWIVDATARARRFPVPRPKPGRLPWVQAWVDPLRRAAGLAGTSPGSSAWVLGGAHSLGGTPLLVADLHVAPATPALFHLAHVTGGDLDAAGAMLPGVPLIWTGRNRDVTWAATHARAAVTDLYVEMLEEQARYHDGRRWLPLRERVETIVVRGGSDETLVVRSTSHGPLLDAMLPEGHDSLALAWVGLRGAGVGTLDAWRAVASASDATALRAGLANVGDPVVAVVYADSAGEAGLQVAGWVPLRPLESGLVPVPGRARWYDWNGRIPYERLPRRKLREGRGWLVAADNGLQQPGPERPEWLWREGTRARRIDARMRDLLAEEPVGLGPLSQIQADVHESRGAALVRVCLALVGEEGARDPHTEEVVRLLREWDGNSSAHSAGAAAYHAFLGALTRALFEPALGDALLRRYLAVSQADPAGVATRMVFAAADGGEPGTWTDPELVAAAVRQSLRDAWFLLSSRLGASRRKWSWGRLHSLSFVPGLPSRAALPPALGPFPTGGSGSTVDTAEYSPGDPFAVRLASLVRFAADPGDPDAFRAVVAPGQSEHPGSAHYTDGIEPWRQGRLARVAFSEARLAESTTQWLVLEPTR